MLLGSESRQSKNTGGLGPDDVRNRERWKAFQEASDMSELCLRGALRLDSTKGLEKERTVLDPSLDFMAYLLPLHMLLTLVSWSRWGVGFGCPLRCQSEQTSEPTAGGKLRHYYDPFPGGKESRDMRVAQALFSATNQS